MGITTVPVFRAVVRMKLIDTYKMLGTVTWQAGRHLINISYYDLFPQKKVSETTFIECRLTF